MTKDEALKLLVEALSLYETRTDGLVNKALAAGKEALVQPEHYPVAWESILGAVARGWCYEENANKTMDSDLAVAIAKEVQALYTTTPQRIRVGLTDEEVVHLKMIGRDLEFVSMPALRRFAKDIEQTLKERNT